MINLLPTEIIEKLKKCTQDTIHHPEGSVYNHIIQVYNNVCTFWNSDIDLLISAIFHDLGKLESTQYKPIYYMGRLVRFKISNIGHEFKSLKYIDEYKHLFDKYNVNWEKVYELVSNHMMCHKYINNELKKPNKRKLYEGNQYFIDIIKFSMCDSYNPVRNDTINNLTLKLQNGTELLFEIK